MNTKLSIKSDEFNQDSWVTQIEFTFKNMMTTMNTLVNVSC